MTNVAHALVFVAHALTCAFDRHSRATSMQVIGNKRGPCFGQPERSKAPSCSIRPRRRLGLLRAAFTLV